MTAKEEVPPSYEDWGKLYAAARSGNVELVQWYLNEGWDINCLYRPHTSLGIAVKEGHIAVVSLLLKRGADPDKCEYGYSTPLCTAAWKRQYNIVKLLLEHGADPNKEGDYDFAETPLISAVRGGDIETIALLLLRGADISLENNTGQTALDIAEQIGEESVLAVLRNALPPKAAARTHSHA